MNDELKDIAERAIFRELVVRRVNRHWQPKADQDADTYNAFLREVCDAAYDISHEKRTD